MIKLLVILSALIVSFSYERDYTNEQTVYEYALFAEYQEQRNSLVYIEIETVIFGVAPRSPVLSYSNFQRVKGNMRWHEPGGL